MSLTHIRQTHSFHHETILQSIRAIGAYYKLMISVRRMTVSSNIYNHLCVTSSSFFYLCGKNSCSLFVEADRISFSARKMTIFVSALYFSAENRWCIFGFILFFCLIFPEKLRKMHWTDGQIKFWNLSTLRLQLQQACMQRDWPCGLVYIRYQQVARRMQASKL